MTSITDKCIIFYTYLNFFIPQRRKVAKVFTCDYNSWWNFVTWRLGGNDIDA
jgi:hypothetical protein